MIKIGQFNKLKIIKEVPFGVYLDGNNLGEILLPKKSVPKNAVIDDIIDVFLYFDSEDLIIATTEIPLAQVGECAFLRVIDINAVGVFLNWGLDKDLLIPRAEQQRPMEKDKSYNVYLKQDNQGRIIASAKLNYYLDKTPVLFKSSQEVSLLVDERTPLGYKVIVNHTHWGLIHSEDVFQRLYYGQKIQGYIKTIRDDGKIDISLRKTGHDRIQELANRILKKLQEEQGFLPLHDKSAAQDIERLFGESKKGFKSAIGQLYKQGIISIKEDGIYLTKQTIFYTK